MNRNVLIVMLLMLSVAFCSFGQTVSTSSGKQPLPVAVTPVTGTSAVATAALTVGAAATKIVGIPAGAKAITVVSTGGVINYGGSDVATGLTHPSIASGAWKEFTLSPLVSDPQIYLCAQTAGATYTAYLRFAVK